jgi:outer membrane protein assembly factor BamB
VIRRDPCGILLSALLVTFVACRSLSAGDWPQWRGPQRDGVDPDSPPLIDALPEGGLRPLWISEPIKSQKDGGFGSPVVVGNRVYIFAHEREQLQQLEKPQYPSLNPDQRTGMSDEEYAEYERKRREESEQRAKAYRFVEIVFCIDRQTGQTLWANRRPSVYSSWPQSASPCVVEDRLYVLAAARTVRCLKATTGDDLWETTVPGEFRDEYYQASPIVVSGVVVVMLDHLFGLSTENGSLLWEGDPQRTKGLHSSPVAWSSDGGDLVIVNVAGGQTACIDPTDGRELWRARTEGAQATPVVVGDRLLTYGRSRKSGLRCYALSREGAAELWAFQRVQDKGSSPVVVDGHVYVQGEKRLACVNLETGQAHWQTTLDLASPQYTSLVAADGKVFYAYEGLLVFAATPGEYVPLIDVKFDGEGLMASEEIFRTRLGLNEIEKQPDGLEKSLRLMQKEIGRQGPLRTTSPAIADGRLYIRTKDALACYDLRVVP